MIKVIIIPGLGDQIKLTSFVTRDWKKYSIEPIIYSMDWRDGQGYESKSNAFRKFIKELAKDGSKISIVGCSAGASMALNLLFENPDSIYKVVSVCGRLRQGNQTGFRSLKSRAKTSPAFAESVTLLESRQEYLNQEQRKRILTIRPLFGDELVPANTAVIDGGKNITIPTMEHSLSIYLALSIFSKPLINFLVDQ